ncbi:hypothetical protein SAMN04488514_10399 [Kriegella aquimaris]|uniref:Uncharacterized protein n=2 Tax=Kriegella aquimaris TaxID=192904 RepID=A0A1G9NAE5_9FLAO|nr:hypothetical protein SAMN04488514_10399 [Kriegella aquimaris]
MIDFIIEYGIASAAIFAGVSFVIIQMHAKREAKKSEEDIKKKIDLTVQKSVDQTVETMKIQFQSVLESLKSNSESNMKALNTQGETIIANLSKKSQEASEIIQSSISKIESDTDRLRKGLLYNSAVLRVRYRVSRSAGQGMDNKEELKAFLGSFVGDFRYSLHVSQGSNNLKYTANEGDFIYSSQEGGGKNRNAYHIPYINLDITGKDANIWVWDFIISYKFEIVEIKGDVSIEKLNSVTLFCDPKLEFMNEEDFTNHQNLKVSSAFLQINGKEYNLKFEDFMKGDVEYRTIDVINFKIE